MSQRIPVQRLYSLVVGRSSGRAGVRELHVLYADGARTAREATLHQVLETLETDLHLYTAQTSSRMTFIHAGVVGWQGRAIIMPGRSLAGKTTLVQEMLRLGATYYSDEFAVIDDAGLVHPFARPLGIREEGSYAQTKCTADSLGAISGVSPLSVSAVVITEYEKGRGWRPNRLARAQGALELLANSLAIRTQSRKTLARLQRLASNALFVKGIRGEARHAAPSILSLCGRRRLEETA